MFLYVRDGGLMLGESRQCEECGIQCHINSCHVMTGYPVGKLHKFKLFIGRVDEISWCDALGTAVCESCYIEESENAVN